MANIFQHIRRGFNSYRKNMAPFFFSFFIVCLAFISIILFGILIVLYNSESILYSDEFLNSSGGSNIISLMAAIMTPSNAIILLTFFVLAILIGTYLSSGIYGVCIEGARGKTSIRTFFGTVLRRGGQYLLSALTLFILWALLFIAVIFPVIVVASLFQSVALPIWSIYSMSILVLAMVSSPFVLSVPIAVVWGRSVADSFKQSFSIGRDNYFELLALIAMAAAINIGLGIIPIIGALFQVFIVIPTLMFTICSYYLDKASVRKGFERKAKLKEGALRVETAIPKAGKMRVVKAKVISSVSQAPQETEKTVPEKKPARAKPKAITIAPDMAKKRRKKIGVYVVARKRPVRIKTGAQSRKKSYPARAKAKKPARKHGAGKAKKSRKA
jgi:hypothetical protein